MGGEPPVANPVISTEELQRLQKTAGRVFVHHAIVDYVVRLVVSTRHPAEHGMPGLVQLFGIESPGLTSALSIAQDVRDRLID